jgi:hypothetical protein
MRNYAVYLCSYTQHSTAQGLETACYEYILSTNKYSTSISNTYCAYFICMLKHGKAATKIIAMTAFSTYYESALLRKGKRNSVILK